MKAQGTPDTNPKQPVQDSPFFPHCCPYTQEHITLENGFRKNKKFITLSKHLKTEPKTEHKEAAHNRHIEHLKAEEDRGSFEEDKLSFLQQIRNYNPETGQTPLTEAKTLNSTMEASNYQQNNLSSLLDTLNNEMFSDLFVSSAVKGKIIMSASLGKISEVRSDMEVSCISQSHLPSHRNVYQR